MDEATYAPVATAIGDVFVAVTDHGVRFIEPSVSGERFEAAYEERYGFRPSRVKRLPAAIEHAVATGDPEGIDLDLRGVSMFTQAVLSFTETIPPGSYVSYLDVAESLGRPGAARAVGRALGSNPVPFLVPCHRVIANDGTLGGYGFGPPMKLALLEAEGADLPAGTATA